MLSKVHYLSLDAFRGIAALSVYLTHLIGILIHTVGFDNTYFIFYVFELYSLAFKVFIWITNPHAGVIGFIVLSGFCIHLNYSNNNCGKYSYVSVNNFYKKRLIRILPTYWLGCFLGLIYLYFYMPTVVSYWDILAKILTIPAWIANDNSSFRFEQGNGPIVTVMAEIWLYIFYPFCLVVINRIGWNKFMIVTAFITLFCYLPKPPFELDRWWLISATPIGFSLYWWIGAYCAELMIRKDFKFFSKKLKTIFLVYILIIFLSYTVIKWDFLRNFMFSILCGQILLFMCINEINLTEYKLKILKAISLLGEKSFTLYVIHIPILAIGTSLIGRNLIEEYKYIVTFYLVGVSIIGTLVCFKLIEHPSHQFAKNYR